MKNILTMCLISISAGYGTAFAADNQFGTEAEARAMELRALDALKHNEKEALAKFNDPKGGFRDRDLYVFCFDIHSGKFLAHISPALLGTNNRLLKEKDGSPLGQKVYDVANAAPPNTIATVSYNWPRPGSDQPIPKVAFIGRITDTACAVGFYK